MVVGMPETRLSRSLMVCFALLPMACIAASPELEVHMVRTTWGVSAFDDPNGWKEWMLGLAAECYKAIESPSWLVCGVEAFSDIGCGDHGCNETRAAMFKEAIAESGLYYVSQLHTCGYPIRSSPACVCR